MSVICFSVQRRVKRRRSRQNAVEGDLLAPFMMIDVDEYMEELKG